MNRWVFSDLHGHYDLWQKIKAAVQPDDLLYCLGDNIDRGPDGFEICLEQSQMKNITVLKGNHEDLAARAIPVLLDDMKSSETKAWFQNGGDVTWENLQKLSVDQILWFQNWCNSLDTTMGILNNCNNIIYLDHAGFTLGKENEAEILWDRRHFWDQWPDITTYDSTAWWDVPDNIFIIHGHTPVQYLAEYLGRFNPKITKNFITQWTTKDGLIKPEIITYCDGHKIDIDLASVASDRVALFNLDTFEVQYEEI